MNTGLVWAATPLPERFQFAGGNAIFENLGYPPQDSNGHCAIRIMVNLKQIIPIAAVAALLISGAAAGVPPDTDAEIQSLLAAVATSGCDFERNDELYPSDQAADHLALKYRRGIGYVSTAEDFIDRLASKSSWSGSPYYVICDGVKTASGDWLHQQLKALRSESAP